MNLPEQNAHQVRGGRAEGGRRAGWHLHHSLEITRRQQVHDCACKATCLEPASCEAAPDNPNNITAQHRIGIQATQRKLFFSQIESTGVCRANGEFRVFNSGAGNSGTVGDWGTLPGGSYGYEDWSSLDKGAPG